MKLTVVNSDAKDLHQSYGISDDRANYLGDQMDMITISHIQTETISFAELQAKIAEICDTPEELAFALTNNYRWLIRTGRIKP